MLPGIGARPGPEISPVAVQPERTAPAMIAAARESFIGRSVGCLLSQAIRLSLALVYGRYHSDSPTAAF
jgi:hypothetical protein